MFIIFSLLVSLFERAYLLLYDTTMTSKERRRWLSWEDYMRERCRRADFRRLLPMLLKGEDPEFVQDNRAVRRPRCCWSVRIGRRRTARFTIK